MKDQLWPAWAFAVLLIAIAASGPWHLGDTANAGIGPRRAPPLAVAAEAAAVQREGGDGPVEQH